MYILLPPQGSCVCAYTVYSNAMTVKCTVPVKKQLCIINDVINGNLEDVTAKSCTETWYDKTFSCVKFPRKNVDEFVEL